jgi:hypothetical protein
VKLTELTKTCGACPSQWSGKLAVGGDLYVRYRWGWLTASVDGVEIYSERHGGEYDGVMDEDRMMRFLGLRVVLAPRGGKAGRE